MQHWEKNDVSISTIQGWYKNLSRKLREGLAQWKREREAQQGWFESWFQRSPWLTTLISTLLGPLIILILLLTFGPCILHHLVSFIRERLNTIQIMVLRQYQPISQGEEKDSSTKVQRQGGNVRLSRLTP